METLCLPRVNKTEEEVNKTEEKEVKVKECKGKEKKNTAWFKNNFFNNSL